MCDGSIREWWCLRGALFAAIHDKTVCLQGHHATGGLPKTMHSSQAACLLLSLQDVAITELVVSHREASCLQMPAILSIAPAEAGRPYC